MSRRIRASYIAVLLIAFLITESLYASCTIGVANGYSTWDGRAALWKVRDTGDARQQLVHVSGSPYDYIGIRSQGGPVFMGLNQTGVASGNSYVETPGTSTTNSYIQTYILENYDSMTQIRNYIESKVNSGTCNATGCFPFIDANDNAVMFEINRSNWFIEYDSMDPDREGQGLLGFVVRANEFHQKTDGTDDTTIGGRYQSGNYNISGLAGIDELGCDTVIQGNNGANGFEFARYGPGRTLATISNSSTRSVMIVHGVAAGEDPNLATMWVIMGQSNYGIAVPTWVMVSSIPPSLSSGDMYDRAKSLYSKGNETTIQASIFPAESHTLDMVIDILLPHWRANVVPSVNDVNRVEHQMAEDAYSLLDCLDNTQNNNKAPSVTFNVLPDGLTVKFESSAEDSDGTIDNIKWNFGDSNTSTEASPSHTYAEAGTYLISCTATDDDGVSITEWRYYVIPIDCDLAGDDEIVNLQDLAEFAVNWNMGNCGEPDWCEGTDLDRSSNVGFTDLSIFAGDWLEATGN